MDKMSRKTATQFFSFLGIKFKNENPFAERLRVGFSFLDACTTGLLRLAPAQSCKSIRNPRGGLLMFLRVTRIKILLQASLHRIFTLGRLYYTKKLKFHKLRTTFCKKNVKMKLKHNNSNTGKNQFILGGDRDEAKSRNKQNQSYRQQEKRAELASNLAREEIKKRRKVYDSRLVGVLGAAAEHQYFRRFMELWHAGQSSRLYRCYRQGMVRR